MPELGWEHAAWQCQQSAMFANLFLEVHRNGQIAIQTQHPGNFVLKVIMGNCRKEYI